MLTLQKPMSRGKYALWTIGHVLLLSILLRLMWLSYGEATPMGLAACLAGYALLCSLTVLTIRRMRDAALPAYLLIAPFVCSAALLLTGIATLCVMATTPMGGTLALPVPEHPLFIILSGGICIILTALAIALLCRRTHRPAAE